MNAVAFSLLISSHLWAAPTNYDVALSRIEKNGRIIDERFKGLGFPANGAPTNDETADRKRRPSLFTVHDDLTVLRASAGRMLMGHTVTRLVVGADTVPAVIDLEAGQGIFAGLRVLGQARPGSTDGRLFIDLTKIVFRSGATHPVKATALDPAGAHGLKAQVFSSKALMVAGAMAGSFITGFATAQQNQTTPNAFGFIQTQSNNRNSVLQGVAQTAADQSKRLIEDATKEKPILVVEPGTEVAVYLEEELRF